MRLDTLIDSHHRAAIAPCPERSLHATSFDVTLPPRTALASDPSAFCRSIRDALRGTSLPVTSLRSRRVGVARTAEPVSRGSLLSLLPRPSSMRRSSTALSIRSSPVRAQPRLDRARAPRGTRAAAIPVRSTDICNPQDCFSIRRAPRLGPLRIVLPTRLGSRRFYAGLLALAVRALPFSSICASRHFLRVTPHGVPLTSLQLSPRAVGTSPAPAYSESCEPTGGAPRKRSCQLGSAPDAFHSPRASRRGRRIDRNESRSIGPAERSRERRTRASAVFSTDPRALLRALAFPSRARGTARSRSLRRRCRSPSLVRLNDNCAHAPVRCNAEASSSRS